MSTYEYGVRYTTQFGRGITSERNDDTLHDRTANFQWCRTCRIWQEEHGLPKDATLMRRLPGGEWEEDPHSAAEIQAWDEYAARINALHDSGDVQAAVDARNSRDRWLAERVQELLAAAGEAR
ncbi:hypothetical protein [Nonomuraea sp. NPDC050786]|uniref:hypothetical protein n=1 Tax=Nonomuraea sp. NPDC050786 TaxID=3154840 RepID=UPI0033DFDB09